ncbi:hypothetical protein VTI74DRAFT_5216 [Chaetomium olivicolor]
MHRRLMPWLPLRNLEEKPFLIAKMMLPNVARIILLVASILSFIPQLRLLLVRRDSSGISLYYVLLNLLVSTELFTLAAFFVVTLADVGSDVFVNEPPDTSDWINLAQLTVICVLWLLTFALTIIFSPKGNGRYIAAAIAIYISYLLISVVPLVVNAATPHDQHPYNQDRKWFIAFFEGAHALFLTPLITILAAAALGVQAPAIGPDARALSLEGLAAQAIVFALLALSWLWRLRWPGPGVMMATWY